MLQNIRNSIYAIQIYYELIPWVKRILALVAIFFTVELLFISTRTLLECRQNSQHHKMLHVFTHTTRL